MLSICFWFVFFFKQKTAYEMRISDWSSDVCSSDLETRGFGFSVLQRIIKQQLGGSFDSTWRSHGVTHSIRLPGAVRTVDVSASATPVAEIGRASCRERVCQYVSISVVAVSLKKNITVHTMSAQSVTKAAKST